MQSIKKSRMATLGLALAISALHFTNVSAMEKDVLEAHKQSEADTQLKNLSEIDKQLIDAVTRRQLALADLAIRQDADVNAGDNTPLYIAAGQGDIPMMHILVNHGAELDNLLQSPLHTAALNGRLEAVEWLVEHGAGINSFNRSEKSALEVVLARLADALYGDSPKTDESLAAIARWFIEHGAFARLTEESTVIRTEQRNQKISVSRILQRILPPLLFNILADENGKVEVLLNKLSRREEFSEKDKDLINGALILTAASGEEASFLNILHNFGEYLTEKSLQEALAAAALQNRVPLVALILDHVGDNIRTNLWTDALNRAILIAATHHNSGVVQLLMARSIDLGLTVSLPGAIFTRLLENQHLSEIDRENVTRLSELLGELPRASSVEAPSLAQEIADFVGDLPSAALAFLFTSLLRPSHLRK